MSLLKCPKCESPMVHVEQSGIVVDRCTACGGLWFDGTEHVDLMKSGRPAEVDTADKQLSMSAPALVLCPTCEAVMDVVFDAYQHHIHYEKCPQGHGVYFDAGEFRDFATHDWSDFFKGLFSNYPRN